MSCERKIALAGLVASVVAGAWLFLPRPPLKEGLGFSRAVFDREGRLLRLTLAPDERYRLWVPLARISPRVVEATLLHEDRFFRLHPGVNPVAIVRAAFRTYVRGGRRMGGSTLTMQLARIRYRVESRSAGGKLLQILRALQLERHYSKGELLEAYLNLAPYGRNIEGVGAASLVYFEKEADRLGLDEALALAVIPQSPARRAPGSPGGALEQARAALGRRWFAEHPADGGSSTGLAGRVVARAPESLPFLAPHFVEGVLATGREGTLVTTLDLRCQRLVERALRAHVERRRSVGIDNAAALLLDRRSMEVLASVGSADFFDERIEGQVDGTRAKRSPGSALKPFLYALAVEQGLIHARTVLKDAPARFRGYDPENFDGRFAGPLGATEALVRSRNVPAVELAGRLHPGLHDFLARAGIARLEAEAHYGLALVLGGAEVTMEELVRLYALLGNGGILRPQRTRLAEAPAPGERLLSEEATWLVLDMLERNPRPGRAGGMDLARDPVAVAWKTGTSHGYATPGRWGSSVHTSWRSGWAASMDRATPPSWAWTRRPRSSSRSSTRSGPRVGSIPCRGPPLPGSRALPCAPSPASCRARTADEPRPPGSRPASLPSTPATSTVRCSSTAPGGGPAGRHRVSTARRTSSGPPTCCASSRRQGSPGAFHRPRRRAASWTCWRRGARRPGSPRRRRASPTRCARGGWGKTPSPSPR